MPQSLRVLTSDTKAKALKASVLWRFPQAAKALLVAVVVVLLVWVPV